MDRSSKLSSIVNSISGIVELWEGLHVQVDAKEVSSTKQWDIALRTQVDILNRE